ncbi:forkhead box protein C2-B [Centropristis striata]|uniref:forkhead box protein C2-B n=1 Tax=Centropristis striata TaxID=184440 RepID=UPI0027E18A25|nr:forkhead box protein C2-B [Centropristis striata]XP_059206057.1 forkhead box protein C2-B [Centropristis striata]XP_059206058.1 forkhead box protein C2-B [Centropristis striata]XP_059206059.1 forkhead box protein C2-B [Centropristis striata]XP_059206061.1 forkhead box protein C2-B [Centropristis striata]
MQNRTEKLGAQLPLFVPASSSQRGLFRKSTTYLAKIAVVLQDAPGKMLTFTQLMDRLAPFISEDRKSVENNIRVCLSTNKCFVKIPVVPDSLDSKRNYWKLDPSQITAKMVRRHFKGILQLFPELASKVETENSSRASEHCSALHFPEAAACRAVHITCEVKFSSPFSIESLLKRDSPSARASRASPLSSVPVRAEQQPGSTHTRVGTKRSFSRDPEEPLLLQAPAGSSSICSTGGSTHHGLTASRAAQSIKRIPACTESSFPVYSRAAAYYTSTHSSYITYSVPTFTHDALRFRL